MTETALPRRICMVIDLNARCDRALARALLGSTAQSLLHALDGDRLVVRGA